jgi:hypothetical protein
MLKLQGQREKWRCSAVRLKNQHIKFENETTGHFKESTVFINITQTIN